MPRTSICSVVPGVAPFTEKQNQVRDRAANGVPSQSARVHTEKAPSLLPAATRAKFPESNSALKVSPLMVVARSRCCAGGGLAALAAAASAIEAARPLGRGEPN